MDRGRMYFEASTFDAEIHGEEQAAVLVDGNFCSKCGQPLDYKYYKQVSRCRNCDYYRVPCSNGDAIP